MEQKYKRACGQYLKHQSWSLSHELCDLGMSYKLPLQNLSEYCKDQMRYNAQNKYSLPACCY